jgi:multidrug resistance efflux pump
MGMDIEQLKAQRDALDAQINKARMEKLRAEREATRAKAIIEQEAHFARMYEEIGQPLAGLDKVQHALVYAQAWEQGHAYGYSEVETHYGELAQLARKLLAWQRSA